ncbi:MAG TPA: quinol:electron acceptor oxidoreductase subunit ActD, partial [Steroidobacteraceae bacterium]
MTGPLLAEFRDSETLQHALGRVKQARHRALDAFTPYPVEGLAEELAVGPSRIRTVMLAGGLLAAALAF